MRARRGEACSARGGGAGGGGLSSISVRAAMVDFDNVKEGKRRSSRVAEVQKAEEQRRREEAERRRREEEEAERRREERKRKAAEREAERARKKARRAAVYEDDDDGAGEADGPDGEDDDGEDGEPEDCETNLRRAWEFAAVVHWCRIFGDSMRLPKFQSADLEAALQQPAPAQVVAAHGGPGGGEGGAAADGGVADGGVADGGVGGAGCVEEVYVNPLVSELVLRLVKSGLVSEREHRELLGDWEGKLFRKLERYRHAYELLAVFPQGNPMRSAAPGAWLLLSPLQRVRVLYLLCILRCDECALVRDAVKRTVDNAEYTADALRNEPVGVDDRGRRYYTFAHMGEDCYLYREKRPAAGREGGRVRWETVATTMEEVRALADGFRGSSSRNERRLHEYLTAYHIPQLEETELERERQQKRVERQLEISLMPRKRSSRIARNEMERAETERARLAAEEEERRMAEIRRRELLHNARETRRYRRGPDDGGADDAYAQSFRSSKEDRSQRRLMREAGITDDHIRRTLTSRGFYTEEDLDDDMFGEDPEEGDGGAGAGAAGGDDDDDERGEDASEEYIADEEEEDEEDEELASDEEVRARRRAAHANRSSGRERRPKAVYAESDEEDEEKLAFSDEDDDDEEEEAPLSEEEEDEEEDEEEGGVGVGHLAGPAVDHGPQPAHAVPMPNPGDVNRTASLAMASVKREDCSVYRSNGADHGVPATNGGGAFPVGGADFSGRPSAGREAFGGAFVQLGSPPGGPQATAAQRAQVPAWAAAPPNGHGPAPPLGAPAPAVAAAPTSAACALSENNSNNNGEARLHPCAASDSVYAAVPEPKPEAKKIKIVMSKPPPPPPPPPPAAPPAENGVTSL